MKHRESIYDITPLDNDEYFKCFFIIIDKNTLKILYYEKIFNVFSILPDEVDEFWPTKCRIAGRLKERTIFL